MVDSKDDELIKGLACTNEVTKILSGNYYKATGKVHGL
jgi:hypothetical protein